MPTADQTTLALLQEAAKKMETARFDALAGPRCGDCGVQVGPHRDTCIVAKIDAALKASEGGVEWRGGTNLWDRACARADVGHWRLSVFLERSGGWVWSASADVSGRVPTESEAKAAAERAAGVR